LAIEQLAGEANCRGLPPTFQRGDEEGRRVLDQDIYREEPSNGDDDDDCFVLGTAIVPMQ